jgi:hypothetical protein
MTFQDFIDSGDPGPPSTRPNERLNMLLREKKLEPAVDVA